MEKLLEIIRSDPGFEEKVRLENVLDATFDEEFLGYEAFHIICYEDTDQFYPS